MGALAGRVVDQPTVLGPPGCAGPTLDGCSGEPLVDDAFGNDHLASGEVGLRLGRHAGQDVRADLGKQHVGVGRRYLEVEHDREGFVVHDHEFHGVGRLFTRLGHDGDDRLPDVADHVGGDVRTAHLLRKHGEHVGCQSHLGNVVGGEHTHHAGRGSGLLGIDADAGVRLDRSDVRQVRGVVELQIIDIRASDGEKGGVLTSNDGMTKDARAGWVFAHRVFLTGCSYAQGVPRGERAPASWGERRLRVGCGSGHQ